MDETIRSFLSVWSIWFRRVNGTDKMDRKDQMDPLTTFLI
jgi:hypothetical protein